MKRLWKTVFFFVSLVYFSGYVNVIETKGVKSEKASTYVLELDRWGIYNDGTHPVETTKGFNDSLKWAGQNGKTTFKVPAGKYLIKKGKDQDTTSRINMVSNMTFELDDKAVIQKETNNNKEYELMYIGPGIKNVTLKGGTYRGDKDTHDYSSEGTHEFGYGILTAGACNLIIDGVKAINFTGDGLLVGVKPQQVKILDEKDFESGSIDDNGNLIKDSTKIRTKNRAKTNFDHPIFDIRRTFQFSRPVNMPKSTPFDVYFYKANGTFLFSLKSQEIDWSMTEFPEDASYFHAVFHTPKTKGVELQYWNKVISSNIIVKNSEFAFNRRQGISVVGAEDLIIQNNDIHDIKGTAPQSGIDLEAGFSPNKNILIKNNRVYNNASYNVILYDGQDVTVENNYLGPNVEKSSIGLAISSTFRTGAIIKNNSFDGSKMVVDNEALFEDNQMNDSVASIIGSGIIIDGMTFYDSQLIMNSRKPFGVTALNITMNNDKTSSSGLIVKDQPVHLKNITITGESKLRSLSGEGADNSIYDNLKVIGYSNYGLDLPRGTYNSCLFEAVEGGNGSTVVNDAGKYVFNGCSFKTIGRGLHVNNKNTSITVKDSTFDISGKIEAVFVEVAKNIDLEKNTINARHLEGDRIAVIKINNYDAAKNPTDVLKVIIKGNTIVTKDKVKGISTIDAGIGAPPFIVEGNILYNAKLELRPNEINNSNQELIGIPSK